MQQFDAMSKPILATQVKTSCGGYLSIMAICCMLILFISELSHFMTIEMKDEMVIDRNQHLKHIDFHLNVSFHHMPCAVLAVNMVNINKNNILGIPHSLYKIRLDSAGAVIGKPIRSTLQETIIGTDKLADVADSPKPQRRQVRATARLRCQSCTVNSLGYEDRCCFTCDDVKNVTKEMRGKPPPVGWTEPLPPAEDYVYQQCQNEMYDAFPPRQGEGCQIVADMHLKRVESRLIVGLDSALNPMLVEFRDTRTRGQQTQIQSWILRGSAI
eukprot:GEMP01057439.1.p1 GENE.GEMP01057439.1~~GEMP01057439.1.p1  ORF type:complete len:271 (+),score=41.20 GEMP01057439.1:92-904(+)